MANARHSTYVSVDVENQETMILRSIDHDISIPVATPRPPDGDEKLLYLRSGQWWLLPASILSFGCATWSATHFVLANPDLRWLSPYFAFTMLYFCISLIVNHHRSNFDFAGHHQLVERWANIASHAGVDILLPTAGEDIMVLANSWNGVQSLRAVHDGEITVYVLDDSARPEVGMLASIFGFNYSVRENRGWFKKAGNLQHGYRITQPLGHPFVVIFDADFRPRTDFLRELLPYFFDDFRVGLVQSPQYFDVHYAQTWLQRGAGAVQEFFYRFNQVARDSHDAAICVGTNAVYRRAALDEIGGTALIEHSEDVHTGFNMRMNGWKLRYIPLILAKGVCPDSMDAFFKQQYRWCMGSMSLLGSRKFWSIRMRLRQRLCYFSGFFYYIHTGVSLFVTPVIPLVLLTVAPQEVSAINYLPLLPALAYTFILFPLWHQTDYGSDAWAVKHVYSWAHLFALIDVLRRRPMGWSPTGSKSGGTGGRYQTFRMAQVLLSFLPGLAWMILAGVRVVAWHQLVFIPLLLSGAFVTYTTARVATYHKRRALAKQNYQVATGSPTVVTPAVSVNKDLRVEAGAHVRTGGYR